MSLAEMIEPDSIVDDYFGLAQRSSFHNLNGPHEHEIYLTGYKGGLAVWDGERAIWPANIPKVNLFGIHVEDDTTIWVCGSQGTLLRGNYRDGFQDLSPGGNHSFNSMTQFQSKLYLTANGGFGGPVGLFTFHNGRLDMVATGLKPDITDIHTVDSADGVLWAVGMKDILCFDGSTWLRIDYPDNPPVR